MRNPQSERDCLLLEDSTLKDCKKLHLFRTYKLKRGGEAAEESPTPLHNEKKQPAKTCLESGSRLRSAGPSLKRIRRTIYNMTVPSDDRWGSDKICFLREDDEASCSDDEDSRQSQRGMEGRKEEEDVIWEMGYWSWVMRWRGPRSLNNSHTLIYLSSLYRNFLQSQIGD